MRRFIYLVLFVLLVNLAQASITGSVTKGKQVPKKPLVIKLDTASDMQARTFDQPALKKYSQQKEFQYEGAEVQPSWWDRFWTWFWGRVMRLFMYRGLSVIGIILNIVMLLLLISGVSALIYFILKSGGVDLRDIFKRRSSPAAVLYSEFFEDINTIDFDAEIENAVSKHNYRFAVRLLYLKCLKQLSDAGLIKWEIDKTNTQYIYELQNNDQRTAFSSLTRQFEYVWYGEFMIDNQVYGSIANSFRDFNRGKA